MATVNALSVALFNAAAGGYAAEMTANPAGFANAVGPILEKDVSTDALFVEHLLANFGVASTNSVYAQAKTALTALVTTKGRAGAAADAVDFLKAQEGSTSAYATIAANFAAKVNAAAAFTAANSTERDITKLISGVTGVDTDAAAVAAAVAAAEAAAATAAAAAATKAGADLAAANAAAEAAATAAAAALAAANAAAEAAATKAAADLAAANTAAEAAATKAAADLAAANTTITALQNPVGGTFALTTSTDTKIGVGSGDAVSGTTATLAAADIIVDGVTGDGDTLTLTLTSDLNATGTAAGASNLATIAGFENVNVTIASTAAKEVNASTMNGVSNLTVTRGDVTVGSSTIAGDSTVSVVSLNATKVAAVTVGADTTDVVVTQATKAGVVVNANNASGNVTVTGAATVYASGMGSGDTLIVDPLNTAAEDAKAVTVTTTAETVKLDNAAAGSFTGALIVNGGASVKNVVSTTSGGGITVTALGETGTVGTDGIVIAGVDASGASVTTSYSGTSSAKGVISIDGSGSADTASVSAKGTQTLATAATNQIESLTLSGNGAAVTYELTGAATTYTVTGSQAVTISGNESSFDGKTLVDDSTGTITVKITTLNDSDLSAIDADNFLVTSNVASKTLTLADGALVTLGTDITTEFAVAGAEEDSSISIATADDTAASGATIDITTGTLTASSNIATLNINATVGKLTMSTATTLATTGDLVVTGTKAVNLAALTASSLDASASSGAITVTAGTSVGTVTTGSGADVVTIDDTDSATKVYTVETNSGNDTLNIVDAKEGSSFSTSGGNDTINLGTAASNAVTTVDASYVIVAGDGNDTINILADVDSDAVLLGGSGNDTLTLLDTDGNSFKTNTNFAFSDFETINISALTSGEIEITAAQFANNSTFKLSGNSATVDILNVINYGSTGTTIDASNVTFDSSQAATLLLEGKSTKADVIIGSALNDSIQGSTGGDTVDGGAGTDTYLAADLKASSVEGSGTGTSTGVVINLGATAVTNTAVLGNISGYTADAVTSVASNTIAYVFAASATTNSSKLSSITNVENITGTVGADYIVGDDNANTITGSEGSDYLKGNLGADTFVFAAAASNGTDTFADFLVGASGDVLEISAVDTDFNSSLKVATLAADGTSLTSLGGTATAADVDVIVLLDTSNLASSANALTEISATANAVTDSDGALIVFYNTATTRIEVYHNTDESAGAGTMTLIGVLSGNASTDIAALVAANFS